MSSATSAGSGTGSGAGDGTGGAGDGTGDNTANGASDGTANNARGAAHITQGGYTPYEGDRTGRLAAIATIALTSFRHVLGLGRPARHKALPTIAIVIAYLPAIVIAGVNVSVNTTSGGGESLLTYAEYYSTINLAVLLFVALTSPEMLTSDRNNGMLSLYLSTPLTRHDYLLAKAISLTAVLAMLTVGPQLLLLVGYTVAEEGPPSLGDWLLTLGRIVLSGLVVATLFSAIAFAVTAMAKRRTVSSIAVVLLFVITSIATSVLVSDADWPELLHLLAPGNLAPDLVLHVFAFDDALLTEYVIKDAGTLVIFGGYLAWVLVGSFITWFSYRRIGNDL